MSTLARRIGLLAVLVAGVSTLLTSAVIVGLARQATSEAAQSLLGRDADVLASIVRNPPAESAGVGVDAVQASYAERGIRSVVVEPGDREAVSGLGDPFRRRDVRAAAAGAEVSRQGTVDGRSWLVEGRLAGGEVVLVAQPVDVAMTDVPTLRRRIGFAVLAGAGVGALAGVLLARALARPIVRVDAAARRLSAGERGVRVQPEGPHEIADLARALNSLSDALAASEERQRRFLLTVSHELRTPLTAVAGYAEALADGTLTGDAVPGAGQVIVQESARLRRRVEELLALARLEADDVSVDVTDVEVDGLLAAASDAWRPTAEAAGVALRVETPAEPVAVLADPERLRQALDALTDNAVRVLSAEGGAGPVVLAARRAAGWVAVEVRDGGPGLDPEDLAVVFEPGRLRERYRGVRPVGSGVGLALVARLAQLMGGRADAARAPEGGLAVTLWLREGATAPPADDAR